MVVTSGVEPIEVEPVAGILQEVAIWVTKDIFPLTKAAMDDISVVPHGFKLPFSQLIVGLVINEDQIAFTKGVRVDMGVNVTSTMF